jgi:hypothetical protein
MKKIITSIILFTNLIGNAQCLEPSNLTYNYINPQDIQLSWTENGTATTWDITVVPDFIVGTPLPSSGLYTTASNPFLLTGLSPAIGCSVFFIRSVCSATDVSPWVAVGTLGCSTNVYNYLATLSNDSFSLNENKLLLFPNPSNNFVQIKSNSKIDKITLFDTFGKAILIQTQNNSEISVENLSKGIYIIEIFTENKKIYRKFIKE